MIVLVNIGSCFFATKKSDYQLEYKFNKLKFYVFQVLNFQAQSCPIWNLLFAQLPLSAPVLPTYTAWVSVTRWWILLLLLVLLLLLLLLLLLFILLHQLILPSFFFLLIILLFLLLLFLLVVLVFVFKLCFSSLCLSSFCTSWFSWLFPPSFFSDFSCFCC